VHSFEGKNGKEKKKKTRDIFLLVIFHLRKSGKVFLFVGNEKKSLVDRRVVVLAYVVWFWGDVGGRKRARIVGGYRVTGQTGTIGNAIYGRAWPGSELREEEV